MSRSFTSAGPGRAVGVLRGLKLGPNIVEARSAGGMGARLTITNHPKGGPVFAGPQVKPWSCSTVIFGLGPALDGQCNAPTKVTYLYQPKGGNPGEYRSYDRSDPPSNVATTETDTGETVPYIVRVEEGTIDRSIYKVMVLTDPAKRWSPVAPQRSWNRKLFVPFGGGCGTMHLQLNPDPWFGLQEGAPSEGQVSQPELLSRGWMTAATGMQTLNYNCNEVVSAESLMMLKEHITETYGRIRRTISVGNSGGSVQQYNIAASYPGLLDGIVPSQSFPDLWSMIWDATECYLQYRYFLTTSPHLWLDLSQQLSVEGKGGLVSCTEFIALFSDPFDPQNRGPFHNGAHVRFGCMLSPTLTYQPILNPTGVRCSVQDYQKAIWGQRGPLRAAPLPYDNTGVQYGLSAVQDGTISPAQFVDINAKIGGLDNEGEFTRHRSSMDLATARTMYRAGRTTDARQLANVPILDVRSVLDASQPETLSDMHQPFFSFSMRARLDAANDTHANQVFWRYVPQNMDIDSALAVDRWLEAVDRDTSDRPLRQKIIRSKPRDLVDTCWIDGEPVTDTRVCARRYPHGGGARTVAGESIRGDVRKCQLKPLRRSDYKVSFTDDQWEQLRAVFRGGVCDWRRPSVGAQPSIPWMSYAHGPGGTPLGLPPESTSIRR